MVPKFKMFDKLKDKGLKVFPADSFLIEGESIYSVKDYTKMEEKKQNAV